MFAIPHARSAETSLARAGGGATVAARTVLIVDDTPIAREPLARLLRHEGYAVTVAANGIEALTHLTAASPAAPDLILLDVLMPKMDGVALMEVLRGDPRWRDVPVIVLTGAMDRSSIERVRALGAKEVVVKAKFELDELLAHIDRYAGPAREAAVA
jgi:chemosensory pili system protein ChpA (sensor histidine kinase/response regulator)